MKTIFIIAFFFSLLTSHATFIVDMNKSDLKWQVKNHSHFFIGSLKDISYEYFLKYQSDGKKIKIDSTEELAAYKQFARDFAEDGIRIQIKSKATLLVHENLNGTIQKADTFKIEWYDYYQSCCSSRESRLKSSEKSIWFNTDKTLKSFSPIPTTKLAKVKELIKLKKQHLVKKKALRPKSLQLILQIIKEEDHVEGLVRSALRESEQFDSLVLKKALVQKLKTIDPYHELLDAYIYALAVSFIKQPNTTHISDLYIPSSYPLYIRVRLEINIRELLEKKETP